MEELFKEFLHIYFWVYIVIIVLRALIKGVGYKDNKEREKNAIKYGIDNSKMSGIIYLTLFILSIYY